MTLTNKRPTKVKSSSTKSLNSNLRFDPENEKIKNLIENNKKVQKISKNPNTFTLKINNYSDKINNYESNASTLNNISTADEINMQITLYDDEKIKNTSKSKIRTNFDIFKEV